MLDFYNMFQPSFWIIVGPTFLLALLAQMWVKGAVAKWSRVATRSGLTGREVALRVLRHAGVSGVAVEETRGFLSDHYDPRSRVVRLSPRIYQGRSVAAFAIAAHEVGHAIQHSRNYAPLKLRSAYVPAAAIGSNLAFPLILLGIFLSMKPLLGAGIILFAAVVMFQLITLPVEFNASTRAKAVLAESGLVVDRAEAQGVSRVLTAAAMTYVAATIQAIATLLYYVLMYSNSRD